MRECRSAPRCRREAQPDSPYCARCIERFLAEAFGPEPRERVTVRRLSAEDPMFVIPGRAAQTGG